MRERAVVSHYFPGEGPPLAMTMQTFDGLLRQVAFILRIESGRGMTDRERVEEVMGSM